MPSTYNTVSETHQSTTSKPNQFLDNQNSKPFTSSISNTVNGTHQSTASQSNQLLNCQNSDSFMPSPLNLANTTHQITTINSQDLESANLISTSSPTQNLSENVVIQVNNSFSI
jgi:hypothetical protein